MTTDDLSGVRDQVQDRYAKAALAVMQDQSASCCGSGCGCGPDADQRVSALGYNDAERGELPADALAASLGCGNPTAVAELRAGETVLDLGSGGGIDVLLSARRVGPAGKAYGLDMTPEMLELARRNAAQAGVTNVEFLHGHMEDIPLPANSIDVVISNCVINLSVDKPAVFASIHRVLRPGGRIGISDIVAADHLTTEQRAERGEWAGCIAGALSTSEYRRQLLEAGFTDIEIIHQAAEDMFSAIIRAVKPSLS